MRRAMKTMRSNPSLDHSESSIQTSSSIEKCFSKEGPFKKIVRRKKKNRKKRAYRTRSLPNIKSKKLLAQLGVSQNSSDEDDDLDRKRATAEAAKWLKGGTKSSPTLGNFGRLTKRLMEQLQSERQKMSDVHRLETFLSLFNPRLDRLGKVERFDGAYTAEGDEVKINIAKRNERKYFVFDPKTKTYYMWQIVIATVCFYNLMMTIARAGIQDVQKSFRPVWYTIDYICDFVYILDMIVSSRTGYLDEGLMVVDKKLLLNKYIKSFRFKLDLVSIIPYDVFYAIPYYSFEISQAREGRPFVVRGYDMPIWRNNRLARCYRLLEFFNATEKRVNAPNLFRMINLLVYIIIIIHWNACTYYGISDMCVLGSTQWVYGGFYQYSSLKDLMLSGSTFIQNDNASIHGAVEAGFKLLSNCTNNVINLPNTTCILPPSHLLNLTSIAEIEEFIGVTLECRLTGETYQFVYKQFPNISWYTTEFPERCQLYFKYVYCMYWSTLTLTTIGETPDPKTDLEFFFMTVDFLIGVLIFATILGNVGSMISEMNANKITFQRKMDSVKVYMHCRGVDAKMKHRVIKWFDYLKQNDKGLDDEEVLDCLPARIAAEVAVHVHLDTLKKVVLFSECEPGLMIEIILKLKSEIFSPGDYIFKKGDIGREMYIIQLGMINVVADDGITIISTLSNGSYFGELSALDIPGNINGSKRTVNVRSVGYTEVFTLAKKDILEALELYPEAKKVIYDKGKKILMREGLYDANLDISTETLTGEVDEKITHMENNYNSLCKRYEKLYIEFRESKKLLLEKLTRDDSLRRK